MVRTIINHHVTFGETGTESLNNVPKINKLVSEDAGL